MTFFSFLNNIFDDKKHIDEQDINLTQGKVFMDNMRRYRAQVEPTLGLLQETSSPTLGSIVEGMEDINGPSDNHGGTSGTPDANGANGTVPQDYFEKTYVSSERKSIATAQKDYEDAYNNYISQLEKEMNYPDSEISKLKHKVICLSAPIKQDREVECNAGHEQVLGHQHHRRRLRRNIHLHHNQ